MTKQTIDAQLLFAQNALKNATDNATINEVLTDFGFDSTRLAEGKALLDDTQQLHLAQVKEYGEQYDATDALIQARAAANEKYMTHLKLARIALKKDRGAAAALVLDGRRKEAYSGWLKQAKAFYTNALGSADYMAALAGFGITQAKLEAAQALVLDTETKYSAQLKETGEAQDTTEKRDHALDALQEWMGDFISVSRIALEAQPQYLEMLGVTVSTPGEGVPETIEEEPKG